MDSNILEKVLQAIELSNVIIGKGAFTRFKSKINYYHMDNAWYSYRDNTHIEL